MGNTMDTPNAGSNWVPCREIIQWFQHFTGRKNTVPQYQYYVSLMPVYFVRQSLGARVPEYPRSSCRTAWTRFELKQPPLSQSLDARPVPVQ